MTLAGLAIGDALFAPWADADAAQWRDRRGGEQSLYADCLRAAGSDGCDNLRTRRFRDTTCAWFGADRGSARYRRRPPGAAFVAYLRDTAEFSASIALLSSLTFGGSLGGAVGNRGPDRLCAVFALRPVGLIAVARRGRVGGRR